MLTKWYSDEFIERLAHLQNDLLRRTKPWTMKEAQEILDILAQGAPYDEAHAAADDAIEKGVEATPELLRLNEVLGIYTRATAVATERLRKDSVGRADRKIEPDARRALELAFIAMLDDGSPTIRSSGETVMLESGLIERPEIRQRLEAMAQSDPDAQIRENITHHLAHYDDIARLKKQYKKTFFASRTDDEPDARKQEP